MRLILSFLVLLYGPLATAKTEILCDSCIDSDAAYHQALRYAPDLQCVSIEGELVCSSEPETVVLVSSTDGHAYAFTVTHERVEPWSVIASPEELSSDAEYVYRELAKFHRNLIEAVEKASDSSRAEPLLKGHHE